MTIPALKKILYFLAVISMTLTLFACAQNEEEGEGETKISRHEKTESHQMGTDCMECHRSGGKGEGWFTVAGTVYEADKSTPNPNGTVQLYTGTNGTGTLVATVEVDGRGNFYTTESINFGEGLWPAVESTLGKAQYMSSAITEGACQSCHGVTTERLWSE